MLEFLAVAATLLIAASAARADGPGAYRPRGKQPAAISEQNAIELYNEGYALILRAEHADGMATAATSERDRAAAQREARDAYKASLKKLSAATRLDASMHEAHTYIGYANRKLGRHEDALKAYEQALRINPDYPHAIEYQGEAFLGLNRIDEARFNYLRLYALNPKLAGKLLRALQSWLEANRQNPPAGVDLDALAEWIAERAPLSEPGSAEKASSSW